MRNDCDYLLYAHEIMQLYACRVIVALLYFYYYTLSIVGSLECQQTVKFESIVNQPHLHMHSYVFNGRSYCFSAQLLIKNKSLQLK